MTTGIDDVEWLDAKVCELSDRLKKIQRAVEDEPEENLRRALLLIIEGDDDD